MRRLRVMTYNIHRGRGVDWKFDLGRTADVIASYTPEVVTLQEVDICRKRSGCVDQSSELAKRLGMEMLFAPNLEWSNGERYGIATLTKLPIESSRHLKLPLQYRSEPRSSLITVLKWGVGHVVEVVNTHLSILFRERPGQVAALAAEMASEALIVAGDFNMTDISADYEHVTGSGLVDSFRESGTGFGLTFPSWSPFPLVRLDYIFHSSDMRSLSAEVMASAGNSDHFPVTAALRIEQVAVTPNP